MASGDTKTEALLNILGNGGDASEYKGCCNTKTQGYILDAIDRVQNVEDDVEELKNNPDVVDIVDTYADLEAYDTSSLTDKDIIRVLQDSNYNNNSTYYRWNATTNQFDFIGEAGSGVNVVQATGTSTTDVMSQDATTKMVYNKSAVQLGLFNMASNPTFGSVAIGTAGKANGMYSIAISGCGTATQAAADCSIAIGNNASVTASNHYSSIAVGNRATCQSSNSIAIGQDAQSTSAYTIAIGENAKGQYQNSVAIGRNSKVTRIGEVNIGSDGGYGFNSSAYRVIGGVYDGQSAHDAATVGQLDGRVLQNAGAPTTATVGTLGQLLEDTTNAKLYQCTAVTGDGGNPEVFTYTWTEVGAGGGGSAIKTLTSADANWPENNPTDIALWKLEPGIYKKGDNTEIWFCNGTSQNNANNSVIGNWTNYQTMFIVGLPVLWNGGPTDGKTLMAFAGATAGDGLSGSYPCIEWAVYNNGNNQGDASTTIRYVKENELQAKSGTTAPTASTAPRYLGDLYIDTANQDCYVNVLKASGANVWKKITP